MASPPPREPTGEAIDLPTADTMPAVAICTGACATGSALSVVEGTGEIGVADAATDVERASLADLDGTG